MSRIRVGRAYLKETARSGRRSAGYWTSTVLTAFVFLSGGAVHLARAEAPLRGMTGLGYPAYFVVILGAWKVLGGLAILTPRLPRLKEWAYAGVAFDLSGAALSHLAVGSPPVKVIVPLVLLGIAVASWALRPASRTLPAPPREPASPTGDLEVAKAEA